MSCALGPAPYSGILVTSFTAIGLTSYTNSSGWLIQAERHSHRPVPQWPLPRHRHSIALVVRLALSVLAPLTLACTDTGVGTVVSRVRAANERHTSGREPALRIHAVRNRDTAQSSFETRSGHLGGGRSCAAQSISRHLDESGTDSVAERGPSVGAMGASGSTGDAAGEFGREEFGRALFVPERNAEGQQGLFSSP